MVEGARLESVYTGNCIKGSNPLVSAEISYFKQGEIKKSSKIKSFRFFPLISLPIFTPFYCSFAGVILESYLSLQRLRQPYISRIV